MDYQYRGLGKHGGIIDGLVHDDWWKKTFWPPKGSPQWAERDTAA